MNVRRWFFGMAFLSGAIYAFGGGNWEPPEVGWDGRISLDSIERFDEAANRWHKLTTKLPDARSGFAVVVL